MADQQRPKPRRTPPSRLGKGPTPGSFRPGVSGNPAGRPPSRSASCFAERARERVPPDLALDLALAVAQDTSIPPAERLHALWPLIDRAYQRPATATTADVRVTAGQAAADARFDALPIDRRRALLESIEAELVDAERVLVGAEPATADTTTDG